MTPLDAAATRAQLADTDRYPVRADGPTRVTLDLKFDGVDYDPAELYDALDAVYAVVECDKDVVGGAQGGTLQLTIRPA